MEPKDRILNGAFELFSKQGIKSTTMDDIAKELGMSKKTLYQYFPNKKAIVFGVTEAHFLEEKCECEAIHEKAANPIDELYMLIQFVKSVMKKITPSMIYDIQKYYPQSWNLYHQFKNEVILEKLRCNLTKGIKEGYYRADLNVEVISTLRLAELDITFNPNIFPSSQYDLAEVQLESFKYFMNGITTIKGKKLFYQYLNYAEDE